MAYIVTAGLIFVLALGCFGFSFLKITDYRGRVQNLKPWRWIAYGLVGVLGVVTLGMSITSVGSRAIGIQTAFGRYQDTLPNGLQLTAPWSEVEEFSTRVQYLDLDGEEAVKVTFKGGGGGEINTTPRWRINSEKAGELWKKYKTFDNVRDKLVNSSAKDAVRIVVSGYTPNEARSGENLEALSKKIEVKLASMLADDGVLIDSISIKNIALDERSQNSLDKIVEANNYIERAKAEQERAKIEAETAKIRQQTGALKPEALTMKCLEILDKWSNSNNGPLPDGFVCPGTAPQGYVTTNK